MIVYYGLIAGVCALWALFGLGGRSRRREALFLMVVCAVLTAVSAARYEVGFDYAYIYAPQYDELLNTPGYTFSDTRFEPGFVALELLIARFTQNYQMLFVVTSVLIIGLIMLYYWLDSPNLLASVFLFLTLSHFYCSMNFIRQTLAGAMLLFAIPLMKRRRALPVLLCVPLIGVAALFHRSALIMLPFILINLLPMNKMWVLAGFGAVTLVLYLSVDRIVSFVTRYWYQVYTAGNTHITGSFDPPFAVAAFAWFLLLLLFAKPLLESDPGNYIYINYAYFAFFFVLMGTRVSILDRFSIYFMLAVPVGLAKLLESLRARETAALATGEALSHYPRRRAQRITALLVVFAGSLVFHHYALTLDHHGVLPYEMIWNQPFYEEYKDWLRNSDAEPALEPPEASAPDTAGSLEPLNPDGAPVEASSPENRD